MKGLPLAIGTLFLTLALFSCGDQNSSGLSASDVAYIRAKRYQEMYGVSSTSTSTTTVSSVVTITSVSTTTTTIQ